MNTTSPVVSSVIEPIARAVTEGGFGFSPASLFAAGEQGAWYDPSDFATLFQDAAGTIPVTAVGQPVGRILDKSGRGNHASQATATSRPVLQQDGSGKYYLAFDGVDDGLATGDINFTSTNKMTVWAGVTKLSDASANGVIVEFSTDSNGLNGAFAIFGPVLAATGSYRFRSRGTATCEATVSTGFPAPHTGVITGQGDISGDSCLLRVNGVQVASSGADQGTGNYTTRVLYIGRRAGTSLPFNGRIYGMIVRGAQSTADQITATERYLANKTGVTLP